MKVTTNCAHIYYNSRRFDEALRLYQKAYDISRLWIRDPGPKDNWFCRRGRFLSDAMFRHEQYEESAQFLVDHLAVDQRWAGDIAKEYIKIWSKTIQLDR